MNKTIIITTLVVAILMLVFVLGRFRFSSTHIIVRELSPNKVSTIKCGFWKWSGGGFVDKHCDILSFTNGTCKIENNTLYINNKAMAQALRLEQRFFTDYELTLQSLVNGDICRYVSK